MTVVLTFFCACALCCGAWVGLPGSTGAWPVVERTVACDPKVFPMGTTLWVEGRGVRVCETTGSLVRGRVVDEYVESHDEALRLGRKEVRVWPLAIMPRDYVTR